MVWGSDLTVPAGTDPAAPGRTASGANRGRAGRRLPLIPRPRPGPTRHPGRPVVGGRYSTSPKCRPTGSVPAGIRAAGTESGWGAPIASLRLPHTVRSTRYHHRSTSFFRGCPTFSPGWVWIDDGGCNPREPGSCRLLPRHGTTPGIGYRGRRHCRGEERTLPCCGPADQRDRENRPREPPREPVRDPPRAPSRMRAPAAKTRSGDPSPRQPRTRKEPGTPPAGHLPGRGVDRSSRSVVPIDVGVRPRDDLPDVSEARAHQEGAVHTPHPVRPSTLRR